MWRWARQNRWSTLHDVNPCCALMLDSMVNLAVLASILASFGFPSDMIFCRMLPGSTLGVLVGNIFYTLLAWRLASKHNDPSVTAMPLGLDTPSTIGMGMAVLGPSFVATRTHLLASGIAMEQATQAAAHSAWGIGAAVMVMMGVFKIACSFFGDWLGARVPQAGLLGAVGGIGLALLSFLPLLQIFRAPEVGLLSLGLVIYTLIARIPLPFGLPGAGVSVVATSILYYILGPWGLLGEGVFSWPHGGLSWTPPLFTLVGVRALGHALPFLPLAIPFGLLTIVGGINACASAKVAGDSYKTRDILLAEAVATLCAGLFGGVAQSTPYIGHPAYKRMGARSGYTLLAGAIVGIGGSLGCLSFVVRALPLAAIMPVMVFVGFEIVVQAFMACPRRHAPAVVAAFLPSIANLILIRQESTIAKLQSAVSQATAGAKEHAAWLGGLLKQLQQQSDAPIIAGLGHGFVLTSMIWGAFVALIIDRQIRRAAGFVALAGTMTMFGLVHSMAPAGDLYLPWRAPSALHWHWSAGYFGLALMLWGLSWSRSASLPAPPLPQNL